MCFRRWIPGSEYLPHPAIPAFRIPVFTRRAQRRVTAHPKFYLFDAGVYRSLRPAGPFDRSEEIAGAALEGLVLQHLIAWNQYRGSRNRVHFWRTPAGTEVDFVLYGEDGLLAIEVKNTRTIHSTHLRALKAFRSDYPECIPLLLYRGPERLRREGIEIIPCDEFLREVTPGHSLPGV